MLIYSLTPMKLHITCTLIMISMPSMNVEGNHNDLLLRIQCWHTMLLEEWALLV